MLKFIHGMEALLDSKQLRAYLSLARQGSFTKAARELGLSQSAISHAMKALELDVGCRLLDRAGKKVALTQAGEQLLFHAEKIQRETVSARQGLAALGNWGQLRLRVAAPASLCQHVLPTVIREFRESFPRCVLSVVEAGSLARQELLRGQRVDVALGTRPPESAHIEFRPLFADELVFVTHPLHPWARHGKVDRATITRQNYLLHHRAGGIFPLVHDYFRAEGVSLPTAMEFGSLPAIIELLKAGLGVSILAPWTIRKELAEGSLVVLPLSRRKLRRQWGALHWQGRQLSSAEEMFVGLCHSVTDQLFSDSSA